MKMMRKITAMTMLAASSMSAMASTATDKRFDSLLTSYKITPKEEQTYCYTDERGNVRGTNIDQQIRLASVTKLITSLWAVKVLGPKHTYDTVLYLKDDQLHIQGSFDPFMSNEKMIYLVSSLNKLGIKNLKRITYDKLVQINPSAQIHTDQYPLITRASNGKHLTHYFNTATWTETLKADYKKYSNLAPKGRYVTNPVFSVEEVVYVDKNPLVLSPQLIPNDVRVITMKSPPLFKYLKEINVKSNNYAAHTVFLDLGGEAKFNKFFQDIFGLGPNEIGIYNGSGLPTMREGVRLDNYGSCRIVADLIADLKRTVERQSMELEDVIAVPGSDGGTFRNRLNSSDLKNTLVAKTGTLMHTSSLAGALNTKKGFSFFGIFNHTTNIANAKAVQNEMVRALFKELGGSKNFKYTVEGFLPYDKDNQIKNFSDLMEDDLDTGFSEIEGELILH